MTGLCCTDNARVPRQQVGPPPTRYPSLPALPGSEVPIKSVRCRPGTAAGDTTAAFALIATKPDLREPLTLAGSLLGASSLPHPSLIPPAACFGTPRESTHTLRGNCSGIPRPTSFAANIRSARQRTAVRCAYHDELGFNAEVPGRRTPASRPRFTKLFQAERSRELFLRRGVPHREGADDAPEGYLATNSAFALILLRAS